MVADMNWLHWHSSTTLPDWQPAAIVGKRKASFLDANRNSGFLGQEVCASPIFSHASCYKETVSRIGCHFGRKSMQCAAC